MRGQNIIFCGNRECKWYKGSNEVYNRCHVGEVHAMVSTKVESYVNLCPGFEPKTNKGGNGNG
jgi:hypothetical protein